MFKALWLVVLAVSLTACGAGSFKVDREEYRQRVRTLGVVPLLVDGNSHLNHPRSQEITELLRRSSASQHKHLVEMLKEKKGYFDVRPVVGNSGALFGRLIQGRAWQEGEHGPYHGYSFNAQTIAELTRQGNTDALLVIVLNGAVRNAKRWDRTHLSYLEAPFNSILASASVVLPSGEVLWEYQAGESFLDLQYPAFDEAYYNHEEEVAVRFITLAGLERQIQEPGRKWLQDAVLARPYQELFDRLAAELKPGLLNPFQSSGASQ
ncbi:MAG: hypothetical protein BA870_09455 [Desulfuromonadales bacterium C00003094]|jgi:hypothetical protein|nr:MAG: hypothetical protein BA870_09455 [Desulfuromonadales bacterium C00003094]OEU72655.1 MAG: hypothetical protein BA869_01565 [Desulfuromonadales bacterium C00003107]